MKKIVLVFLLVVAIVTVALVFTTFTKPAPHAADLLPDSTLVFLDIPDFTRSRDNFSKTELYALWQEPEVQAFLNKPLTLLRENPSHPGQDNGNAALANFFLNTAQGEVFLGLTHITILPSLNVGLVAGADVGHKKIQAIAGLYKLEASLQKANPQGDFEERSYLGVKYSLWQLSPELPICHAFFNSLVVFTLGEDTMRDLIASYTGQVPVDFKRLSTSPRFTDVQRHASRDYEFLAYANVEEVLNLFGPLLAFSPQTAGAFQKLSGMNASAFSMKFVDRGVEDVSFVSYSHNAPAPAPPVTRKTIALTSPDTLFYSADNANLSAFYEESMQALSQSGNTSIMSSVAQFQQGLRTNGIHMQEDILQRIGPETAVIATWREGARFPDVALAAEISHEDTLRPALDNAMNALKQSALGDDQLAPWDESVVAGHTLRTVRVGAGQLAPTYTTTGQFLILAGTPDYARELVTQTAESKPTLASNTTYQQFMSRMPANASAYSYADLRGLFAPLYAIARSASSAIGNNEFVDINKLPPTETISKHLFPFVSATVSETGHVTSTSFSPVGKSMVFVAGAGGGIWAATEFGPQLEQLTSHYTTPASPRRSSNRAVPSAPNGNQTAPSQTPAIP
ncbi:MAG TPA: DUF3352 domain-containing protein [Verrucomicrobiae bacterium]|nr:DUF3352 domain-containing protein [Verrucomicrobiae bacterium]